MRVLCHAQNFSGIGHAVRMRAIARGLRPAHEVYFVDGGKPFPVRPSPDDPETLPLPRLFRVDGRLADAGGSAVVPALLEERASVLTRAVERIRPDTVPTEDHPVSKWE